jgi:acyl-coenzyme A synthetase/AMP-(fatty) acid ligase
MARLLPVRLRAAGTRLGALARLDPFAVLDLVGTAYRDHPLLHPAEPVPYPGFDGEWLTGGQLAALGYRLAHVLRGLGVAPNDRVIVFRRNHPDYLIHMHAVIAAGGVPVSVNTATGWPFLLAVAEHTGARLLLTDAATLAAAGADELAVLARLGTVVAVIGDGSGPPGTTALAPLVAAAPQTRPERRRGAPESMIALFHTSGTTGVPKLCVWNGANSRRIWKIMTVTLPVGTRSRLLMAYPYSHALYFALGTGSLICGAPMYAPADLRPETFLAAIGGCRATGVFAFPHLYMRALGLAEFDRADLDSVRIWATGADKIHAAHIARLVRRGRLRVPPWGRRGSVFLDSYGSTEIGAGGILQMWLPGSDPVPCRQGRPMPTQFGFRIVDRFWRDLPDGEEGRILVRSTTAFAGYWNDHGRWAASRIDGWWWAGDVGRRDERGRLLFLDREADSVETRHGVLRTLPVEERLLAHPRVLEAAVFRGGDEPDGSGWAAALVVPKGAVTRADLAALDPGLPALEAELLDRANRDRAGPPLAALRAVALADVPFGATGKVLKTRLRAAVAAGELTFATGRPSTDPDRTGVPV